MTRVLVAPSTRRIQNDTEVYGTGDTDRRTEFESRTGSDMNQADSKETCVEYRLLKKKKYIYTRYIIKENKQKKKTNLRYRVIYLQICARVE